MFDFIELATSSRILLERVLLEEEDAGNDNNILYQQQQQEQQQQQTAGTFFYENIYNADSAPLLSKSAEAELYLLATNFLLCT